MIPPRTLPQITEQIRRAALRAQGTAGRTQRAIVPEQPIIELDEPAAIVATVP